MNAYEIGYHNAFQEAACLGNYIPCPPYPEGSKEVQEYLEGRSKGYSAGIQEYNRRERVKRTRAQMGPYILVAADAVKGYGFVPGVIPGGEFVESWVTQFEIWKGDELILPKFIMDPRGSVKTFFENFVREEIERLR